MNHLGKRVPVVSTQALQQIPFGRPITLGCAPCKMREKQEKANQEFAERFGYVVDPRYPDGR